MKKILLMVMCTIALIACGEEEPTPPTFIDRSYAGHVKVDGQEMPENVTIWVRKNDEKTVNIELLGVKFSPKMPTINMVIPAVTFTSQSDVRFFSGDDIVPTTGGAPFPKYTITELEGEMYAKVLNLSMMCGEYPLTFSGNFVAK